MTVDEAEVASTDHLENFCGKLLAFVGADESPKFAEQNRRIVENYLEKQRDLSLPDCYKVCDA